MFDISILLLPFKLTSFLLYFFMDFGTTYNNKLKLTRTPTSTKVEYSKIEKQKEGDDSLFNSTVIPLCHRSLSSEEVDHNLLFQLKYKLDLRSSRFLNNEQQQQKKKVLLFFHSQWNKFMTPRFWIVQHVKPNINLRPLGVIPFLSQTTRTKTGVSEMLSFVGFLCFRCFVVKSDFKTSSSQFVQRHIFK